MSFEPVIVIRFDDEGAVYQPGQTLSGQYWIESLAGCHVKAVELSVLWYTEGKGEEDMAVHDFWRHEADDLHPLNPAQPQRFSTSLPNSPLSYQGRIIKIRWCVRLRAFLNRGKELVGERDFQFGTVAPLQK
jgi:hypothetical protein